MAENRRGRPRAEVLNHLILEGSSSVNPIKCKYCNRVFPREKSLQAHLRTHTGERPYACDYPGCKRAFTQSGQLKTHQRLHTGEKPFVCSVPECNNRFTHANRHCPEHPYDTLLRCESNITHPDGSQGQSDEITQWLERQQCSPKKTKRSLSAAEGKSNEENEFINEQENYISNQEKYISNQENLHMNEDSEMYTNENIFSSQQTPSTSFAVNRSEYTPLKLSPNNDINRPFAPVVSPQQEKIEKPKRRWLREVEIDQARGLINIDNNTNDENQNRPTVLVSGTSPHNFVANSFLRVQEMQGALALMELANSSHDFYTQL